MSISVFIPAHNEAANLLKLVPKIAGVLRKDYEIVVVNDNSTDNSTEVLSRLSKKYPLRFAERKRDPGPGNAYRKGFGMVKGDIVITMDGDLSHDPGEIPSFLKAIKSSDVVCGSRYVKGGEAEMGVSRVMISGAFNIIFRHILGIKVRDFTSGYRAIRKEVIDNIRLSSRSFGIYIEIPIKAHMQGYRISEIPITYHVRNEGKSNLNYFRQGPEYIKVALAAIAKKIGG